MTPTMPANDTESDAAHWLIRLEADPSPQTRADFEAWLGADARHQAAYIRMERTWSHADIVKRLRPLDGAVDEEVIDNFGERSEAQVRLEDTPGRSDNEDSRRGRTGWLALAASLAIVSLGATVWMLVARSGWQVYHTEFGGFQRVVLADGSTAMLNTDSRIRVRMSSGRREVVLEQGEVLFTVAHDIRRPFDVTAADTVVRAVGTAFSVRLRDHKQVDVLVTEGRVAIDPTDDPLNNPLPERVALPTAATLSAGESVSVKEHRRVKLQKVADDDLTRKLAWTQGRIWFDQVTLQEAVAEFNRYNRRQLVIEDPNIAGMHIGGTFDATDLDSFVAALRTFGISVESADASGSEADSNIIHLVHSTWQKPAP
jgi:transmembrane sensor